MDKSGICSGGGDSIQYNFRSILLLLGGFTRHIQRLLYLYTGNHPTQPQLPQQLQANKCALKLIRQLEMKSSVKIQQHYKSKFRENYFNIQWDFPQMAIKRTKPSTTVLKMLLNICPTQAHMTNLKITRYLQFPCCTQDPEDMHHILTCISRENCANLRGSLEASPPRSHIMDQEVYDHFSMQSGSTGGKFMAQQKGLLYYE